MPSGGGEGDSSLRSNNGGGGSGSSGSANNTVGSGNESAPASLIFAKRRGGGVPAAVGKVSQRLRPPRHPTLHPRQIAGRSCPAKLFREGQMQPGVGRRIARVDCRESARGHESKRVTNQAETSAREEMYAFNVDNVSSPGESEFGFSSPIGLHVGQAESIPPN